jgi:uncharacterized iron-regulated protein
MPADPATAILDGFRSHTLVAIGEPHGNEQAHALRVSLVRDRPIAGIVNDIVVEFGDARYQDVMDRFVRGAAVSNDALRQVWQNTTQGHTVWDVPIYEEFFRAVRATNISRPRERQFRVLLGDPPTRWESVRSLDDVVGPMADDNRDRYPADLIRREVLAKNRRALIIYGDGHLWRDAGFPTPAGLLQGNDSKVFTIASANLADLETVQADVISWPRPSIAIVRDTSIGVQPFAFYFPLPPNDAER